MKWLASILLLLNAALFLWASGHEPGRSASAYPVVNEGGMSLLSELKAAAEAQATDAARCARIGPFRSSSVASVAAQKLQAMSLEFSRRTVESREIRAHRVYLGPFESQAAVSAQRRLLDASGVGDYYVKTTDGGETIISLGLFSQPDGADALQSSLAGKGVQTRLRSEDRVLPPNFWLEVNDPAVAKEIPEQLSRASWGESQARIRHYPCP